MLGLLLIAAGTAGLLFAGLALLVAGGYTRTWDVNAIVAFQSVASDRLDVIANADTLVGYLPVTLVAAAVLTLIARQRLGGWAWLGPALILGTGAIELVLKLALAHPSPPAEYVRAFGGDLAIRVGGSSFPSGHLSRVTFLALTAAYVHPRAWTWLGAAALIAASVFLRVYLGDHWISDTLGGALLGTAAACLAMAWMRLTRRAMIP